MFNKLVKGFVVGVALIGSLTMVGCESTESVLEEGDRIDIENEYYNDNPSELPDVEDEVIEEVDEDEMKGFIEEETEVITDEDEGNKDYDPYTKALVEEELNEFHMDCSVCGRPEAVYEKAYGNALYDVCGYCYAVYENQLFTGRYACNGCEEIVNNIVKPIDGKGTALVCEDCYDQYHNPKTNENLDSEGNFINNLE